MTSSDTAYITVLLCGMANTYTAVWISGAQVKQIPGALSPAAYVGRAYRYALQHNDRPPRWARKDTYDNWQFNAEYITANAQDRLEYIGISEAARLVDATRASIQGWVDRS